MRCREARQWLNAHLNGELERAQEQELQKHLARCAHCRATEQEHRRSIMIQSVPAPTPSIKPEEAGTAAPSVSQTASISTDQIMRAIQQQKQATRQLEEIQHMQKTRIERLGKAGAVGIALGFLTLSSIPLLFLAMAIMQTNITLKTLSFLNGVIDTIIITSQYLHSGLTLVMGNSWLLTGLAFAVIVMMGMWLRLMRTPQEA